MANIYKPYKVITNAYGKPVLPGKEPIEFVHIVGMNVNDIILFENGTDDLLLSGATILPRHYYIFVGTKDGELQYKPYEYNQYRIVVSTYKNIIHSIDSIG